MISGQRFRALLFDFDETLVPEYEVANTALRELSDELVRLHPEAGNLDAAIRVAAGRLIDQTQAGDAAARYFGRAASAWYGFELVWDDKSPLADIEKHVPEFRRMAWDEAFRAVGVADDALADDMSQRLPALVHERRVPYSDSERVLAELGKRHDMAIVTNGEPAVQARKVDRSGLRQHFAHVVLANEHGSKPNPAPFNVAVNLLGVRADEVAMVGNSLANDIAGAQNAGIYSVWVNRGVQTDSPGEGIQPDATVQQLTELLDLL